MTDQETIDIPAQDVPADAVQPAEDQVAGEQKPEQAQESPAEEDANEEQGLSVPDEEPSELDLLRAELEQAQAKADEYLDGWQRARAEFANYRRREEQRRQQLGDTIKGQVLSDLLPVVDDLDRAFHAVPSDVCETAWVKGLSMVGDKLQSFLVKAGVAAMALQPGDAFDPNYHQAVFHGPSAEHSEGQIVEVFQRGYTLGEMVLRPAMVYVSSGVPEEPCVAGGPPAGSLAGDSSVGDDNSD